MYILITYVRVRVCMTLKMNHRMMLRSEDHASCAERLLWVCTCACPRARRQQ